VALGGRLTTRPDSVEIVSSAAASVAGLVRLCAPDGLRGCLDGSFEVASPGGEWLATLYAGVAAPTGVDAWALSMGLQWTTSTQTGREGLPAGLVVKLQVWPHAD